MFDVEQRIFRVHGVSREHQAAIRAYLQEKVDDWCVCHRQNDHFEPRDLIGGEFRHWEGTPLLVLYDYYLQRRGDRTYAYREAAKAAGRIFKDTIERDENHTFHIARAFRTVQYTWVQDARD